MTQFNLLRLRFLSRLQKVDEPVLPGARGLREFLTGVTDEALLRHRRKVRAVSPGDVASVMHRYLGKDKVAGIAVLGPEKETLDGGWKVEKLL